MKVITCDKCGSTAVERLRKQGMKKEVPEVLSMTEYATANDDRYSVTPAIMTFDTFILFCLSCGHKHEYTPGVATTTL